MTNPFKPQPEGDDLHGKGGLEVKGEDQTGEQLAHNHMQNTSCTEFPRRHGRTAKEKRASKEEFQVLGTKGSRPEEKKMESRL